MPYEDKTPEAIHEEMLSSISDDIDKREGSVTHDLLYPAAIEVANAYVEMDMVLGLGFVDTSEGEYLERICLPFGISRRPSVKAQGVVTLSGPIGTIVPEGTRLQTNDVVFFVTTDQVTLTGSTTVGTATAAAIAENGGVDGNVLAGEINALAPGNLYGVVSVTNPGAFDGGVDVESDESLRKRLLDRAQNPATSGNANHYRQWALEIPGVGEAKVYPTWNGPGTVKVVLLDTERTAPSQTLVNEVTAHINANKPIGPTVTIEGAQEVAINITATLTLDTNVNVENVETHFITALKTYFSEIAFVDAIVRYTKIASILIDIPGVIDYTNLKINNATNNITVADGSVPSVGTVTFT